MIFSKTKGGNAFRPLSALVMLQKAFNKNEFVIKG